MTDQLQYERPGYLSFPDRSGRLIAAGVLLVISGLALGCVSAMIPVAAMAPQPAGSRPPVPPSQLVSSLVLYITLTLTFLVLGAGAITRKRWSRPLTMIISTHWLIAGVVALIVTGVMWPTLGSQLDAANVPDSAAVVVGVVMIVFMTLCFVALPLSILLLMRSVDVQRTLEAYDPQIRWTDRCPLPVLGLSLTLGVLAFLCLLAMPNAVLPVFGTYLVGAPAVAATVAVAAGYGWAAYDVYRLRVRGWWVGLLLTIVASVAVAISGLWMPLAPYYRASGMTTEQIEVMLPHETLTRATMAGFSIAMALLFAIYMIRLKPKLGSDSSATASSDDLTAHTR